MIESTGSDDVTRDAEPWRRDRLGAVVLLILTFAAGGLDAIAFLDLGGAFVANQTGTVLLLGMNVAGTPIVDPASAIVSLALFALAAGGAARLLPKLDQGERWPKRTPVAISIEVVLVIVASVMSWLGDVAQPWIIAPMAAAMGIQATLGYRVALRFLTTGWITGATVGAMVSSPAGDNTSRWWWFAAVPMVAMAAGAGLVALIIRDHESIAFVAIAALMASAAVLTRVVPSKGEH